MEADAFSEETRAQHEQQNNDIWINRFPTEIISRIFISGDQRYEIEDESVGSQYIPTVRPRRRPEFQEIIVQVCRAWRKVAIDTQMLWTFISLDFMKPKLRQRAITFLERSGSTIPLTVEIDITGRSSASDHGAALDHQSQTRLMQEHLVFLASHDGSPSRWDRLTVWLETSSAMFAVLEFLSVAALDNLRTLMVVNSSADSDLGDNTGTEVSRTNDLSQHIMFRTPPPALRLLELDGVTMDFFFSRMGTPLASNLTHLHLGPTLSFPPLKNLHDLLVNTPQLQSLGLDVYMVQTNEFQPEDPGSIRLSLPKLRRILLREPCSVDWGMAFLRMIDAPGVEVLALSLNATSDFPYRIPQYVARGRVGGRLRNEIPGPRINAGPIYPSLKELELGAYMGNPMSLETILASSTKITRLDWEVQEDPDSGVSIKALMSQTSSTILCPHLERLKVTVDAEEDLIEVVRWRKNRGHPLKIVEVPTRQWAEISENGKAVLTSELHEFRRYRDGTEPEGGWGGRIGGEGSNDNADDDIGDGIRN